MSNKSFIAEPISPSYLFLTKKQWCVKLQKIRELASPCMLCPRKCRASRLNSTGVCNTGENAIVASYAPHFGEEAPLVGTRGSGTIFFSNCNLKCMYCQNYSLAHFGEGRKISDEDLAQIMLRLQKQGCHNINLVSPTHVMHNILAAVKLAAAAGLKIPIVYNTGGYDSLDVICLLDGVIDIYMPDMKYSNAEYSSLFSQAKDYPLINFAVVKEMHRQVGDLVLNDKGYAVKGLLVRHLVLPCDVAGTEEIARYLANDISESTYVNVMKQYRPYYKANGHSVLGRGITGKEYKSAVEAFRKSGLSRIQTG